MEPETDETNPMHNNHAVQYGLGFIKDLMQSRHDSSRGRLSCEPHKAAGMGHDS